jgi:hemerythrin-like domain-containing protein
MRSQSRGTLRRARRHAVGAREDFVQAIGIIEAEHRSLAAVLHGMLYLVRDIRFAGGEPNFELLGAMVHYIDAFPEHFHHPKEDAYLFEALRRRSPAAAPLLDRLTQEHARGTVRLRELQQALTRCQQGGAAEFPRFAALVASYAAFHWDHMRLEENDLLPQAKMHLSGEDWQAIDAAFLGHTDPMLGAEAGARYDALFRRIVDLAPPPLGRAPARGRE